MLQSLRIVNTNADVAPFGRLVSCNVMDDPVDESPAANNELEPLLPVPAIAALNVFCQICECNHAAYTCPRCNARYCSLTCYRGPAHADCADEFYRSNCEHLLKDEHVPVEERRRFAERLERINNENDLQEEKFQQELEDEDVTEEQDPKNLGHSVSVSDDEPTLSDRLAGLDLESEQGLDIAWSLLNPDERREFNHAVQHGQLTADLVGLWVPWWAPKTTSPVPSVNMQAIPDLAALLGHNSAPNMLVVHNLLDALMSYAFSLRLANGDWMEAGAVVVSQSLVKISAALHGSTFDGKAHASVHQAVSSIIQRSITIDRYDSTLLPSLCTLSDFFTLRGVIEDTFYILAGRTTSTCAAVRDLVSIFNAAAAASKQQTLPKALRTELINASRRATFLLSFAKSMETSLFVTLERALKTELEDLESSHNEMVAAQKLVKRRPNIEMVS